MSHPGLSAAFRRRPRSLGTLRRLPFTRWLLTFALLMMLGQQTALAAYACTMAPAAMASVMTMAPADSMEAMGATCPEMQGPADRVLCQKHCVPEASAQPDARTTSAPASLLTALPPSMDLTLAAVRPPAVGMVAWRHHPNAPPRPFRKLFCSLQI